MLGLIIPVCVDCEAKMLGIVIFLVIIAFFGFLLAKRNAAGDTPSQKSFNVVVNNVATIWDGASGHERLGMLATIGLPPDHPLFAKTMVSKYVQLDQSIQMSILGVIEGIRLGVIK